MKGLDKAVATSSRGPGGAGATRVGADKAAGAGVFPVTCLAHLAAAHSDALGQHLRLL